MLTEERWEKIIEAVNASGSVSVPELMTMLDASESTIRRDLVQLDRLRKLIKVRGGATRAGGEYIFREESVDEKALLNREEKRRIAEYAVQLIGPEDFVYIDAGTTTECLVDLIEPGDTVYVTNSIGHARKLLRKGCRVILPGGELKAVTEALVGADTVDSIRRFHFTLGFFGTNGLSEKTGFTTPEPNEAAVKRTAMEHTARRYVLCDHSKFSRISPIAFAAFNFADIITDKLPDGALADNPQIHVVSEPVSES